MSELNQLGNPIGDCAKPRDYRCKLHSMRRFGPVWRAALGAVLAAIAAWAAPPESSVPDFGLAYGRGQVTEALALARKYLTVAEAAFRNAKSDSGQTEAWIALMRDGSGLVMQNEMIFPLAGRFRNSMDLLAQVDRVLATLEAWPFIAGHSGPVRHLLGNQCRVWLAATTGIKPRAEQARFFRAHAVSLSSVGAIGPDEPIGKRLNQPPSLTENKRQQVIALVQTLVRGYLTRDAAAISGPTGLSAAVVSSHMAAGEMNFFAATADRVSKYTLRPISAEYISEVRPGRLFGVYLPDVLLQLQAANGAAYSKTVDRVLFLERDSAGRFRVLTEETPAEE